MQLTLYFTVSVLMLVDSYEPLSVNHIKYIKKKPNHSAPYMARYRWKDTYKMIPKLVGHSDPRHYHLGSKLKIQGRKEKLKNYDDFTSTNNSRRIAYRYFDEWSLHSVSESINGTQDLDAKTSKLNIHNDKPNENKILNMTSEVNSTEMTKIKIVDDALNDITASKSDVSPLFEPVTVNDGRQLAKSHVDNLFKALYKNKLTKTKVKHNEINGLYLNELDVDFEKDVAPIAENFSSDNNVIQVKGTDTSTTKPKVRKGRQSLKGLQDEIFTGGEETNLKRSVPGEAGTYIIKKIKSPISLNQTFPMKDKNPIVPVTPVMESEKESLELYNERIRNHATTAARDFLSKFIRKNLLRVRVKPILNTNRKKLGVEFVNDGLAIDIDEPLQTTETTTNILANILQHEDDAPLYNFMYNNNNTILNLLHNTNFLKDTGHKNVSKEPAPTDLNRKVWRNIRDVLKMLLPENKIVKALYTVDGEKTQSRKTERLVQRSEPCKNQDISCIFDRMNKLVNRIKRRAQISDEDMPHNFLQLQPYGIAADYDDGKAFEELFEQPDFDIQNLEDPVKDLPPSSPLYIPYYIGKYDKPHQHLRKGTYMRVQGDEVHPYHSHMPEIIWSKYDPLTNYYYTDFLPLNPKELEPPRIIETSDIDSVNTRRKSNFISDGDLSPKYDGMFDLYNKPIIKKIPSTFIPEKIPERHIPENYKFDQQRYKSAIFDPMEPNIEYFDDLPEIFLKKRSVDAHDYDDMQSNSFQLQSFDGIDNVQKLEDALHPTTKKFRDQNVSKRDNEVPNVSLKTDTSTPLLHHIESVESETIGSYDNDPNIHNFMSNRNADFKDMPGNNLNTIANTDATKQPTNEVTANQDVSMTTVKIIINSSKMETGQSNEEYFSGDEEWYEEGDNKKYIEDYSSKISDLIPLIFLTRTPNETYNTDNFNTQKVHKKLELNFKINGQKSNIEQIEDPIEETSTPNKAIDAVSKENFQTILKLANQERNNTNTTDSNRTPTKENSYNKIDNVFTHLDQSPSILPLTYGQSYPYVKKIIERYIVNSKGNENPRNITANRTAKEQVSKTSHKDTATEHKSGIHDNESDTEVMETKQDSKTNVTPTTKIAVIDKTEIQFQTHLNDTESETTMMERELEELKVIALKMHNLEKNFKQIKVINSTTKTKTENNDEIVKIQPKNKLTKIEPKHKMNKTETTTTSKKIELQTEFNEIAPNNTKTTVKTSELKTDIIVISPNNTQTTIKPTKTTMKMIKFQTEVKEIATKNEAIKFESDTEWTEMKVESEILKIKPKVEMVRNKSSVILKDKSRPPKTKRTDFESDTDWTELELNHEIMNIKPMTKISTKLTKHNIGKREIQSQTPERHISLPNRLEQAQITEKSAELKVPFITETDPLAELEAIITGSENKKSQNQHQQIYSWRIITPPAPEAENKTTHIKSPLKFKAPLQKTKRAPFESPIITEIKDNRILETDSPYDSEDVSSTPPEREKKIRFSLRVLTSPTSEAERTDVSPVTANTEETASETESEDLESTEMTKIENTTPKTKKIRKVKKTVIVTKEKQIESSETFNNTTTAGGTKGKQLKLCEENKTEMTETVTKHKHLKSSNKLTKKTAPKMKKKHNKSLNETKTKKTRKSRKRKHRNERRRYIDIINNEVSFEAEQVRTLSENVNKDNKELRLKYDDIHRNYVKHNALPVETSKFREFEELSEFSISKGPLRRQKPNIVDKSKHIGKKISLLGLWDSHKGRLPKHNKIAGGVSPLEIWKSFPVPSQSVARSLGKRQIVINEKRPRLLCAVLKQENEKEDHIVNTWGKRCDILAFITVKKFFGGPKKVEQTWEVALRALKLIYKKHNLDADWFLKTDIHSYIMVDNLYHMLQGYKYEPLYFGPENLKECSTFVLNQEALKSLVEGSQNRKCHSNIVYYEFGICLTALDIKVMTSQDDQGRPLFYSYGPFDFKKRQKETKSMHFRYWSDFAVAFQNVDVEDMYTMEYMIHRVKTTQRPPTPVTMRPLVKKPWIKNNEISNDVYEISNDNDDYLNVF